MAITFDELTYMDWVLIAIIVAGIIYILITRKWFLKGEEQKGKQPFGEEPVRRIEGWMITWIDALGDFANVPWHKNLQIIYGDCFVYGDGRIESIRSTFDKTYYNGDLPRKFNAYFDQGLVEQYGQENENGEIIWADGTNQHRNIYETHIPVLSEHQSKGTTKKNVQDTMKAMKKRK